MWPERLLVNEVVHKNKNATYHRHRKMLYKVENGVMQALINTRPKT